MFAELPDRVHGEVLSPLGRPELVLDGGAGRLAVTFPGDGESYSGLARPDSLARIVGVGVSLEQLVRALLTEDGSSSGELRVERQGPAAGLPQRLELRTDEAALRLELKRLAPLGADPAALGTGLAPAGSRPRPLEELELDGGRPRPLGGSGAGAP